MTCGNTVIALHGGLDTSRSEKHLSVMQKAVLDGSRLIKEGRVAALEAVLNILEDNSLFNCGYGSVLNTDGEAEMDAAVVDGASGRFAAVAALKLVRRPISVARLLLEKTHHVLLAGEGALRFALRHGFPLENCISPEQLAAWQRARQSLSAGCAPAQNPFTGLLENGGDTVGCVVCDGCGLAAASSTGGCSSKLPGRVGDTPFLGGGIFASPKSAVVCTGVGEAFVETLTARYVDEKIAAGLHPQEAVEAALMRLWNLKRAQGGILALDASGRVGAAFNAGRFPVVIAINGKIISGFEPADLKGKLTP